jgi:hypothetical protein
VARDVDKRRRGSERANVSHLFLPVFAVGGFLSGKHGSVFAMSFLLSSTTSACLATNHTNTTQVRSGDVASNSSQAVGHPTPFPRSLNVYNRANHRRNTHRKVIFDSKLVVLFSPSPQVSP